jgi:hypothetical protein
MQSILECKVLASGRRRLPVIAASNDNDPVYRLPTRLLNDGWWLQPALPPPTPSAVARRAAAEVKGGAK